MQHVPVNCRIDCMRPPCTAARALVRAMIDREKVLTVLQKRFPGARLTELAAAANAIVGLEPEFEAVSAGEMRRFLCETLQARYSTSDVASGDVRVYRRMKNG